MRPRSKHGLKAPKLPRLLAEQTLAALTSHEFYADLLLSAADFSDQRAEQLVFEQAHLRQVTLLNTRLPGLRLMDTWLERCELSAAAIEKARLRRVTFTGCRMLGSQWLESSFEDVLFQECLLEAANFALVAFKPARFEQCNLRGAVFTGANLEKVVFDHCDLTGADLRETRLQGVDLRTAAIDKVQVGIDSLQGAIIAPFQAAQIVNLLGIRVLEVGDEAEQGD